MSKTKIIGICGYARSGKNALCDAIEESLEGLDLQVNPIAFGDGVKDETEQKVQDLYGVSVWSEKDKDKEKFRTLIEEHGRNRRLENPDYWINRGLEKLKPASGFLNVFIDVRTVEEFEVLKKMGGLMVYIGKFGNKPASDWEADNIPKLEKWASVRIQLTDYDKSGHPQKKMEDMCDVASGLLRTYRILPSPLETNIVNLADLKS